MWLKPWIKLVTLHCKFTMRCQPDKIWIEYPVWNVEWVAVDDIIAQETKSLVEFRWSAFWFFIICGVWFHFVWRIVVVLPRQCCIRVLMKCWMLACDELTCWLKWVQVGHVVKLNICFDIGVEDYCWLCWNEIIWLKIDKNRQLGWNFGISFGIVNWLLLIFYNEEMYENYMMRCINKYDKYPSKFHFKRDQFVFLWPIFQTVDRFNGTRLIIPMWIILVRTIHLINLSRHPQFIRIWNQTHHLKKFWLVKKSTFFNFSHHYRPYSKIHDDKF